MKTLKIIQSVLLSGLGGISVFMTLSIIFDCFGIREKEGNYVLFIVYTNLICGLIYLYAAYINWKNQSYSFYVLVLATGILTVAFFALQIHIDNGGIHEAKTIRAMMIRIVFTAAMAAIGWFILKKSIQHKTIDKSYVQTKRSFPKV